LISIISKAYNRIPDDGLEALTRASKLTKFELAPKKFSGVFLVSLIGDSFLGLMVIGLESDTNKKKYK